MSKRGAQLFIELAEFLDRRWGWDRLPPTLGLLSLGVFYKDIDKFSKSLEEG